MKDSKKDGTETTEKSAPVAGSPEAEVKTAPAVTPEPNPTERLAPADRMSRLGMVGRVAQMLMEDQSARTKPTTLLYTVDGAVAMAERIRAGVWKK